MTKKSLQTKINKFKEWEIESIVFKGLILGQEYRARISLKDVTSIPIMKLELYFLNDDKPPKERMWSVDFPYELMKDENVLRKGLKELIEEMLNNNIVVDI